MIPTHPELRRASRSYAHTATRIQKQKGFLRADLNPKSSDRETISFQIRTTVRIERVEPYYHNAQKLQRYALRHRSGPGTAHRSRFIQIGRKTSAQLVKLREQQALPFLGKASWSTRPQSNPPDDSPRGKTDPPRAKTLRIPRQDQISKPVHDEGIAAVADTRIAFYMGCLRTRSVSQLSIGRRAKNVSWIASPI